MECSRAGDFFRLRASLGGLERAAHTALHQAICDACGSLILGVRFRCADCADFDLCRACVTKEFVPPGDDGSAGGGGDRAEGRGRGAAAPPHKFTHRMLVITSTADTGGRWAEQRLLAAELACTRRSVAENGEPGDGCGAERGSKLAADDSVDNGSGGGGGGVQRPAVVPVLARHSASVARVRPLEEADLPGLVAIENICFLEPYPAEAFAHATPRPVATASSARGRRQSRSRTVCLVADVPAPSAAAARKGLPGGDDAGNSDGGREDVVGGYILLVDAGHRVAKVASIATRPDCRGRGVAQALLERALAMARAAGSRLCDLHVHVLNTGAQRLYHRVGFHIVRRLREYYRPCSDGQQQSGDAWLMRLEFPSMGGTPTTTAAAAAAAAQ